MFTPKEINKAKELAYINWENRDIGFLYKGTCITNPFLEESGRFEFTNYEAMCEHYGNENIEKFIKEILENR